MNRILLSLLALSLQICSPAFPQSYLKGPALIEGVTSTATAAGTTTLTKDSQTVQVFTGSTTQTVVLPDATTLPVGRYFEFYNLSSGSVTVNYNGGSLARTLLASDHSKITLTANGTAAGTWAVEKIAFSLSDSLLQGVLPMSKGGSEKALTAAAGGLVYTDSDSMEVLAAGTSGYLLKSNGTSAPSWLSTIPIANGGTGQTTASAAFDALAPSQTSNSGKFLTTNGTTTSWAAASLSTQGQEEGSSVSTLTLKAPYNQLTTTGTNERLIETGNGNFLANPSFEHSTPETSWTLNGTVLATAVTSGHRHEKKALNLNFDTTTGTLLSQDVTPTNMDLSGMDIEHSIRVKTSISGVTVCARQAGSAVGICQSVETNNKWKQYTINYPGPSSGSVGISVVGASSVGDVKVDDAYVGPARNTGTVAQAEVVLRLSGTPTGTIDGASTISFPTELQDTYNAYSSGTFTVPKDGSYCANIGVNVGGTEATDSYVSAYVALDGTNQNPIGLARSMNSGLSNVPLTVNGCYTATRGQLLTLRVNSNITGAAFSGTDGQYFHLKYFPSSSQTAVNMNQLKAPTVQKFTSGSGTYTLPTGVTHIRVRMVGGGGGGGGSGDSSSGGTGGAGGNTTFGSSLLTANGGNGGAGSGGTVEGGSATISSPAYGTALKGGSGNGVTGLNGSALYPAGGGGGASAFGGNGAGTLNGTGGAAAANTGGGGGGSGGSTTTVMRSGGGGGAGAYIDAWIVGPSATYSYAVGAAGTAGTAGTNGYAGGAGGSGYIEVTEYYAWNMPLVIGGVSSSSSGMEYTQRARLTNDGSTCSVVSSSGSWISASARNAAGDCTWTMAGFTAEPVCQCTPYSASGDAKCHIDSTTSLSSTTVRTQRYAAGADQDGTIFLSCQGPR